MAVCCTLCLFTENFIIWFFLEVFLLLKASEQIVYLKITHREGSLKG